MAIHTEVLRLEGMLESARNAGTEKRAEAATLLRDADTRQLRARTGDVTAAADVPLLRRQADDLNREAAEIESQALRDVGDALEALLGGDVNPADVYRESQISHIEAALAELAPDAARILVSVRTFSARVSSVLRAARAFGMDVSAFGPWMVTTTLFGEYVEADLDLYKKRVNGNEFDEAVALLQGLAQARERHRDRGRDRVATKSREAARQRSEAARMAANG